MSSPCLPPPPLADSTFLLYLIVCQHFISSPHNGLIQAEFILIDYLNYKYFIPSRLCPALSESPG